MKKLHLVLALAVAGLFLAGCVVTSVYPFFTAKDIVYEPALLGRWAFVDPDRKPEEPKSYVRFENLGKLNYSMTTTTDGETNLFNANLFVIKGRRFLDHQFSISNNPVGLGYLREHFICSVAIQTNTLRLAWLREDWLEELLKNNANAIRHTVVYDSADDTNGRIVLTAETSELQKFILKYSGDTNAWFENKYAKETE